MTKSPFEIRLDILGMVKEMLDNEQKSAEAKLRGEVEVMKLSNYLTNKEILNHIEKTSPKPYTSEEVLARSNSFYSFVMNKK